MVDKDEEISGGVDRSQNRNQLAACLFYLSLLLQVDGSF